MNQMLLEALSWNLMLLAYAVIAYDVLLVLGMIFDLAFRKKEAIAKIAIEETVMHFLSRNGFLQMVERHLLEKSGNADKDADRNNVEGKEH